MQRSRFARYNKKNPDTGDYVLIGAGALAVAGIAYWLYSQSQANAAAAVLPATAPPITAPIIVKKKKAAPVTIVQATAPQVTNPYATNPFGPSAFHYA